MTDVSVAEHFKVNIRSVMRWNRRVDWEHVRDERRKLYARHTAKVDSGLIARAIKGEIDAVRLYYERFDGYVPETKQIQIHQLDEALIEDELNRLMQRRLDTARVISAEAIPTAEMDASRREATAGIGADQALSPAE